MEATAQRIEVKRFLIDSLRQYGRLFALDLESIPEDQFASTFGGCTRSVTAITAEVISYNEYAAALLRGQKPERGAKEYASPAELKAAYSHSVEAFADALADVDESHLLKMTTAPWGQEMPVLALVGIGVTHNMYHDGQINYIQCLLGDEKIHWL